MNLLASIHHAFALMVQEERQHVIGLYVNSYAPGMRPLIRTNPTCKEPLSQSHSTLMHRYRVTINDIYGMAILLITAINFMAIRLVSR